MIITGTIVNVLTILIGGGIGLLLNKKLPPRYVKIFFQVIGLFTLLLGISMALKSTHILHMVLSLITGALFSAVPLLIYQGGITLFSAWLGDFFPQVMITELSAVGGILLMGLGIQILEIKKLRIINMLPALIMIILFLWLFPNIIV